MKIFIFLTICNNNTTGDNRLEYLILGSILTLAGSLVVLYFNNLKDRRKLIANLKSEIVGICDKMIKYANRTEFYKIKAASTLQLYKLLNYNIEVKKLADNFLDRQFDTVLEYDLLRADLLRELTELYNYIKKSEIEFLNEKHKAVVKIVFRKFDFKDCLTPEKLFEEEGNYIKNLNDYIMDSSFGKPLQEIKKSLNPHI